MRNPRERSARRRDLGRPHGLRYGIGIKVVSRTDVNDGFAAILADKISSHDPKMAPRFLGAHLTRQLGTLEATPDPLPEPPSPGATETEQLFHRARHRTNQRFCNYIDRHESFHDLPKIAEATPAEFLNELWPWFLRMLAHVLQEPYGIKCEYRRDRCSGSTLEQEDRLYHPIFDAMERAVRGLAKADSQAFLTFARASLDYDAMVVQRLLCRGFSDIVEVAPDDCLTFLASDPRRLYLGAYGDESGDTRLLISRLASRLDAQQMQLLERTILDWSGFCAALPEEDASLAVYYEERNRVERLRLLKTIPLDKLSAETQILVKAEEQALGEQLTRERAKTGVSIIGSPVSLEQMASLNNDEIAALFEELPDDTGSDHPRDWSLGGSIQLSGVLGEFAKKDPARAVALLPQFSPGRQERPAGAVIRTLGEIEFPSARLYELILDLDARGFSKEDFRDSVGYALMRRAGNESGLPDEICKLLERWLASSCPPADDQLYKENENDTDKPQSVLWQHGGG